MPMAGLHAHLTYSKSSRTTLGHYVSAHSILPGCTSDCPGAQSSSVRTPSVISYGDIVGDAYKHTRAIQTTVAAMKFQ